MEKNYYEILQVNEKSTKEVIEKVYKILAKKYHPDLQKEEDKAKGTELFKEINEAYQTLSDVDKRNEYDKRLKESRVSKKEYVNLYEENQTLKKKINELKIVDEEEKPISKVGKKRYHTNIEPEINQNNYYQEQYNEPQYYYTKQTGGIKSFIIDKLKGLVSIIIVIVMIVIIFQIPFVNNFCKSLYENNQIIKAIVDTFMKILSNFK